ncbi:MAG: class I SAM-dependent methyltransferase [Bacteroidetes bacterium]|nr:class I SAM-dependent methyltransferase [Bacteroidota bacterium]
MQQEQVDWFERWFGSEYYQILYRHRDELEAKAFVHHLINYLQPLPLSSMLDIACGEGRHSKELADLGFDVVGIDLSATSIQKAKQSEEENLQFFVHDMRYPFYTNYFDYAFNFFTSFGYFATQHDHQLAAKSFARGLKKGGILVIDYLNREYALQLLKESETVMRDDFEFLIKRRLEGNHFVKDIFFYDQENMQRHYTESVAAFTLADFIRMFKAADLSLIANFGDYELNTYHPLDSPRMIMVFKK